MRIAYVCADPGVSVFGCKGCSIHVQEMLRAMIAQQIEVDLFATRIDGPCPAGLESVRVHHMPRIRSNPETITSEQIEQENQARRRIIESCQPFDIVYERYSLWNFSGMESATDSGVPGILEVNAPLIEEQETYRGLSNRELAGAVLRRAFQAASVLIAVSPEVAGYVSQWTEAANRVHVVANGVNVDRFRPVAEKIPARSGRLTIGFVGTLKPWHGVHDLLDAFDQLLPRYPQLRLLIVGDGPERKRLEEQARLISPQAISFAGAVQPAEVPETLCGMDIAVAPYPQMDQCYFSPLKVYEYAAAGLAIVTSRIGEPGRVIDHEIHGLLSNPGDASDLATKIERLICHPEERFRFGRNAREHVCRHHTWSHVLQRILNVAGKLTPVPF